MIDIVINCFKIDLVEKHSLANGWLRFYERIQQPSHYGTGSPRNCNWSPFCRWLVSKTAVFGISEDHKMIKLFVQH